MNKFIQTVLRFFIFAGIFTVAGAGLAATSLDYYQAGLRLYDQHQYADAERYFQAAIQEDSNNWQAYQGLGLCQYAQGDKSGAKASFQQSLSLHPDNPSLKSFSDGLDSSGASSGGAASSNRENSPIVGGGNFGIGLDFGGPGTWGATGKYWMDDKNAFQGAIKLDGGTLLQLEYLWHDYDLIHPSQGAFPFYIGVGGDLGLGGGSVAVAVCAPIGITYLFQKKTVPIDIFVEVVPTIWITGGINFQLYGDIGSRFYF
jgi:tetratricopeptide (TPR) repeat protein